MSFRPTFKHTYLLHLIEALVEILDQILNYNMYAIFRQKKHN